MTVAPRSTAGCAVRITTTGAVAQTFRVAPVTTWDSGASVFYAPDLFEVGDGASSLPDPKTPVASASSYSLTIANRDGQFWAALNAGVTFDGATVEMWLTYNDTFDSTDDPYWSGNIDGEATSLDDDTAQFTARGPMRLLDGVQLPRRVIDDETFPNAPSKNKGRVLPMRWGSWLAAGRFSEYLCVNATNGELRVMDTLCADETTKIPMAASYGTPDHSGSSYPNLDGLAWFMDASKFDTTKLRQMASHANPNRRTLAYETTSNRVAADASFRLGGTTSAGTGLVSIRIADPPEDTPDPETTDPCDTVTVEEDVDDPTIQEQCPTVPPRLPHDSWGGLRAGNFPADTETIGFDPEADICMGYHGGYIGIDPDGSGYGRNNVPDIGAIFYEMIRYFGGIGATKIDAPTFFSPDDWPAGPGTQSELTYKNSPQLEQQYALIDLLAAGCWENGALLAERAGKISLRRFNPMGSGSSVYAITPRVVSAAGVKIVPGRWGGFANEVTFQAYGDGMDPTQNPRVVARARNQDSIDQRAAAGLPPVVPYVVGEEYSRKHGLFLDGTDRNAFKQRAGEMVAFLSALHAIYEVELQPAIEESETVMGIDLGDHVTVVWPFGDPDLGVSRTGEPFIPEDEPATCLVIGRAPSPMTHTIKLRLLRFLAPASGEPACEVYGTYMAGTETFPASLGGGAMQPYDEPGWSADQESYALCNGGYYGRHKYGPG